MNAYKLIAAGLLLSVAGNAHAILSGPVGTPCSGTTTAGTVVVGTQGWSTDPKTGRGYWSCCMPRTACSGRDKPKEIVIRELEGGGATKVKAAAATPMDRKN